LAKGIASLFEEVARMPYKNYYLAKSLQACIAMMIMVCSVASLFGQDEPPFVKGPDYAIPIDFTIKIQMKSKKLIKNARTFDNKILEVKDVLNDPKSIYLKGLAEGVATLELISTDEEREELSIYVLRQQTPVNNIKFLKETTIDIEHLKKTLAQALPNTPIDVSLLTSDSVFVNGVVNSTDDLRTILHLASKVVDPNYQNKEKEGSIYDLNDSTGQKIVSVSSKVVTGLKLRLNREAEKKAEKIGAPPSTSFDLDYLKKVIIKAVPNSNIQVIPITKDSVILSGYVSRAEDISMILSIASNIVDPTLFDGLSQSTTTPTNNSGQTNPTNNANGNMSTDSNAAANSQAAQSAPRTSQKVINALRVAGVQQVQLDVVVAQVSRTEFRNLGFNFLSSRNSSFIGSTLSGLSAQPTSMGAGLASGASSGASIGSTLAANGFVASTTGANVPFGVLNSNSGFLGFLQALRIESASKLLAEPKLVTSSGKKASFLVGGEQAVISATSGVNGPGVAFVQIGTRLDFLPVVLGNGKIQLTVNPSIKSVNNDLGIANPSGPGRTPGFDDKQVTATVEMETGQTFVIGGLIQNETRGSTIKMPVLGDLPFLGVLFSSKSFQEVEQEVVILVTPYLVDPQSCDQLPKLLPGQETRSPDDFELFLEGILEAPRGPRKVIQDRRYIPAFKNAKPLDAESGESRVPGNLIFPARNQENPKPKELPIIETQPMPLTLPEVSNSEKTSEVPLVPIKNSRSSLPIKVLPWVANPNNSEPKIKTSSLQTLSPVK
jgi:Flp pilus assembly secretin CpaC